MTTARITAIAVLTTSLAVAGIAFASVGVRFIAGGQSHTLRAVQVADVWYVNADDVARALGNGATFDEAKLTFYASARDRGAQMHTVDKAGGGFATDGTIAAHLVSVKQAGSFQGNAPDPGAHFVMATIELKNVSHAPVSMYLVQTSMVAGSTHLNDGQFYEQSGTDLPQTDVSPGQTVTYLDVFELDDGVKADAILVHPPFAPTTAPVDILLKL